MKSIIFVLILIGLTGCVNPSKYFSEEHFPSGVVQHVKPGGVMFSYAEGVKTIKEKWITTGKYMELNYLGVLGTTLQVQYREYYPVSNQWLMREMFTQTLGYNISKNDTMNFRGLLMYIENINTQGLDYIILNNPFKTVTNGMDIPMEKGSQDTTKRKPNNWQ